MIANNYSIDVLSTLLTLCDTDWVFSLYSIVVDTLFL